MIYYLCPDNNEPIGGVKKIYTHVDILNSNGFPAYVLHRKKNFRCDWFRNTTQIAYLKKSTISEEDFIVIPEFYNLAYMNPKRRDDASKGFLEVFASAAQKVIFNQNTYYTFYGDSFDTDDLRNIHIDDQTVAAMVVSEDGALFLRRAFPGLTVMRVHNSIDTSIFSHEGRKKNQICFMPRKNRDHAINVINILKYRGVLDGFPLVPIEGKTEKQTSEIMKESLIFLSFGYPEGFSLPPAEAMACGCIVIGYHGMGGKEYFNPDFCYPIETGNILDFAGTVEDVIKTSWTSPALLQEKALKGSSFIRENYSPAIEQKDVLSCWETLHAGMF